MELNLEGAVLLGQAERRRLRCAWRGVGARRGCRCQVAWQFSTETNVLKRVTQ